MKRIVRFSIVILTYIAVASTCASAQNRRDKDSVKKIDIDELVKWTASKQLCQERNPKLATSLEVGFLSYAKLDSAEFQAMRTKEFDASVGERIKYEKDMLKRVPNAEKMFHDECIAFAELGDAQLEHQKSQIDLVRTFEKAFVVLTAAKNLCLERNSQLSTQIETGFANLMRSPARLLGVSPEVERELGTELGPVFNKLSQSQDFKSKVELSMRQQSLDPKEVKQIQSMCLEWAKPVARK
jgi:hypothetical protein